MSGRVSSCVFALSSGPFSCWRCEGKVFKMISMFVFTSIELAPCWRESPHPPAGGVCTGEEGGLFLAYDRGRTASPRRLSHLICGCRWPACSFWRAASGRAAGGAWCHVTAGRGWGRRGPPLHCQRGPSSTWRDAHYLLR